MKSTIPLMDIIRMRQHMKGLLSIVDMYLNRFEPVCRKCFYTKALVDRCDCGDDRRRA